MVSEKQRQQRSAAGKASRSKLTKEQRTVAARRATAARWADRAAPPANAAEIIQRAAAAGCTKANIARALGVGGYKLRQWLESPEHGPALQAAMAAGKEVEHDRLVGLLMAAAHDASNYKGNYQCAMFLLKTRHGYVEGQALVQNSVSINYQLPAPLSVEDYLKSVAPGAGNKQIPAAQAKLLPANAEVSRG